MNWSEVHITVDPKKPALSGADARRWLSRHHPGLLNPKKHKGQVILKQGQTSYFRRDDIKTILESLLGKDRVRLDGAEPKPPPLERVAVLARRHNENRIQRESAKLDLHLDANRDGVIDDAPTDHQTWEWGADGPGAVILVQTRPCVNAADVIERAPLELRWKNAYEQGWEATLTVDKPEKIRVFRDKKLGDELLLGGNAGGTLTLQTDATLGDAFRNAPIQRLWMEAADYPDSATESDWRIKLTLEFKLNNKTITRTAVVRIAPWIMAADTDPTDIVLVRDVKDAPKPLPAALAASIGQATTSQFIPIPSNLSPKGFMRDVLRCGYSTSSFHNGIVILKDLDIQSVIAVAPKKLLDAKPYVGVIKKPADMTADNQLGQDNGGNLLVSPPQPASSYPYGRIIYGDSSAGGLCHLAPFLTQQRMQKPIVLESSWLDVGHVDEFLTFVPNYGIGRNPDFPYKVLIASPRLAYMLLHGTATVLQELGGGPDDPRYGPLFTLARAKLALYPNLAGYDTLVNDLTTDDDIGPTQSSLVDPLVDPAGPIRYTTVYNAAPAPPAGSDGKLVFWTDDQHFARTINLLWGEGATIGLKVTPNGVKMEAQNRAPKAAHFEIRKDVKGYLERCVDLWKYSLDTIQPKIDAAREKLKTELGIEDTDFIEIPVTLLKTPSDLSYFLTPDSVNMLVLNDAPNSACRCIIPMPFGPVLGGEFVFQRWVREALSPLRLTLDFINDLDLSVLHGEIHCGSNQLHAPLAAPQWWLAAPP